MSFDKAKEHLKKYNLENNIIVFEESTATVYEAALALGCSEGEIAKSMGFILNEKTILIIAAGNKKIDNAKFKAAFHVKAKMIPFEMVEELTGHAAGGVCPFAVKSGVEVYLDESLKEYSFVYPACGNHHSAVKLTINELESASEYISWVDVCK